MKGCFKRWIWGLVCLGMVSGCGTLRGRPTPRTYFAMPTAVCLAVPVYVLVEDARPAKERTMADRGGFLYTVDGLNKGRMGERVGGELCRILEAKGMTPTAKVILPYERPFLKGVFVELKLRNYYGRVRKPGQDRLVSVRYAEGYCRLSGLATYEGKKVSMGTHAGKTNFKVDPDATPKLQGGVAAAGAADVAFDEWVRRFEAAIPGLGAPLKKSEHRNRN